MGRTSDARQRLMDAVYELIWEYSYGAVTIDAICERAAVKKGSFYYFFESKSELASAAIEAWWKERRMLMNELFRRENPPLERIRQYMDFVALRQLESFKLSGHIHGCPLHALAAEICTQDERLRVQLYDMLKEIEAHFETAIADAQALGQVEGSSPTQKTRVLLAFYAGILTDARITNDPNCLRQMSSDALGLLGVRPSPAAPVLFAERVLSAGVPDEQLVPSL